MHAIQPVITLSAIKLYYKWKYLICLKHGFSPYSSLNEAQSWCLVLVLKYLQARQSCASLVIFSNKYIISTKDPASFRHNIHVLYLSTKYYEWEYEWRRRMAYVVKQKAFLVLSEHTDIVPLNRELTERPSQALCLQQTTIDVSAYTHLQREVFAWVPSTNARWFYSRIVIYIKRIMLEITDEKARSLWKLLR